MTNEEIFGIINYVNSFSFSEFEMETKDIKIRIKKDGLSDSNNPDNDRVVSVNESPPPATNVKVNLPSVVAPITGVFYSSPAPGEAAFISVGDHVKKGDTLCILEAMKMMNEVKSDKSGVVKEILASDGDSVEECSVLFVFQGE